MAAKGFGRTWWGNTWVEAMERIDSHTNRLPRGRRYANNRRVLQIEIEDGEVRAKVQGTRPSPYRISIRLRSFPPQTVDRLKSLIAPDPALASYLALGKLPRDLLTLLQANDIHILPTSWEDLSASCSCPDWANPCKHLAAVYYLMANEIDKDPFLLFRLRGVDADELMQAAGLSAELPFESHEETFLPYGDVTLAPEGSSDRQDIASILSSLPGKVEGKALFALLCENPLFYTGANFKQILLKAYTNVAESIQNLELVEEGFPLEGVTLCLLYPGDGVHPELSNACFFAYSERVPVLEGKSSRQHVPEIHEDRLTLKRKQGKILSATTLFDLFLTLPLETSPDHTPSVRFMSSAMAIAQAIAESGAFVPRVSRRHDGSFHVRYQPLYRVKGMQLAMDYLADLMPPGFVFRKADKCVLTGQGAVRETLTLMLTHIAFRFSMIDDAHKVCDAFFHGGAYEAEGFSEQHTAKAIDDWLACLNVRVKEIAPVIRVEIPPGRNLSFTLQVDVENRGDPLAPLLTLDQVFSGGEHIFSLPADSVRNDVARQLTVAASHFPPLKAILGNRGQEPVRVEPLEMAEFLRNGQNICSLLGFRVVVPKDLVSLASPQMYLRPKLKDSEKVVSYLDLGKILDFSWEVALGHLNITKEEFSDLARSAGSVVRFKEHYLVLEPKAVQDILDRLNDPVPGLSPPQILQASLTGESAGVPVAQEDFLKRMMDGLIDVKPVNLPEGLEARLRPYQVRGFQWLYCNALGGFGSCLADDMGLGKTLQALALILKLKEEGRLPGPALVICPTTLIGNWAKECHRFTPSLKASVYHGSERRLITAGIDLVITTYGILRRDIQKFKKRSWGIVIIDEAQNIKNPGSEQTKAVKSLNAKAFVALSGTPVENRLSELWSIFDYLNQGYLGSHQHFLRYFALPIEKYRDKRKADLLKKAIGPFLLRRLKSDRSVIQDLPDKIVSDDYCYLSQEQAALYRQVVDTGLKQIAASEGIARRGLVFRLMTSLKQICNHPVHYVKKGRVSKDMSGKAEKAVFLLDRMVSAGEKALLFTQYKEMGDLLVEMLRENLRREILFFHGGLTPKKRERMIEVFQTSKEYPVLVVSLKAGGTGLNLTAATNVIHYDLWWNPAVEEQATDRTYRIGQTENVSVYRLITLGTLEERIDEIITAKKELAEMTVSAGETWISELSNEELARIVKLAAE